MGQLTLGKFKSRLDRALGQRASAYAGDIVDWINDGYLDMCGAHDFVELRQVSTAPVTAEDDMIPTPNNLHWIRSLVKPKVVDDDDSVQEKLIKQGDEHLHAIDATPSDDAELRYWTRSGSTIYISPPWESEVSVLILFNREPDRLVDNDDVTELPAIYDKALHQFSMYHALSDLGEETRASQWRNNGILYIRSRLDPKEFESAGRQHGAARFPKSARELREG